MNIKPSAKLFILLVILSIVLISCSKKADPTWQLSPVFEAGGMKLVGHEGRFGMIRMSGDPEEGDLFRTESGGLFGLYFWNDQPIDGNYLLSATHQESGDQVWLYEAAIQTGAAVSVADGESRGKFMLSQNGRWRLDVKVNNEFFDSIVVQVGE